MADASYILNPGKPPERLVRTLAFSRSESGLWFVTSEDEPSIFMSHRNLGAIIDDLPNVLRRAFKLAE